MSVQVEPLPNGWVKYLKVRQDGVLVEVFEMPDGRLVRFHDGVRVFDGTADASILPEDENDDAL